LDMLTKAIERSNKTQKFIAIKLQAQYDILLGDPENKSKVAY